MGRPRMLELLFLRNQYENEKASQTKLSQKCFGLHTIDEIERVRERVGDTRADQLPLTDGKTSLLSALAPMNFQTISTHLFCS